MLVAGPLVAWIVGALEGAAVFGGLSAIGAGLSGMGIPKDSVVQYEAALKTDKFLLMVHGTAAEVEKAKDIIESTRPVAVALHATEVGATATNSDPPCRRLRIMGTVPMLYPSIAGTARPCWTVSPVVAMTPPRSCSFSARAPRHWSNHETT